MNLEEYRIKGKEVVDFVANYLDTIRCRQVYPNVKPEYMRHMLPDTAPYEGQKFDEIMDDIERVIMPGVTHWQSPYMHAYFPALNSPASLLADMIADGINCLGFTWASSPAATELEIIVMDWLAKMIGLPPEFLHQTPNSTGGGVIQTTSSEATLVCLLAARNETIRKMKEERSHMGNSELNSELVAYTSDQAHSSVEKAGLIGLVKMRYIESDSNYCIRKDKLLEAIAKDKDNGLVPFFLCATLGTTGACSFDCLKEIGPICASENIWLHTDAAYAGASFICPEHRKWLQGIEYASSFAFNPSKWMMVHFDCTAMWVKRSEYLHRTFNVDPLYLKHENTGLAVDFMHWQIPLSRRFRALKLWFVIRNFGVKGLQQHIRKSVHLAEIFEQMILTDDRFEIPAKRHLGMVVFRLKGGNEKTEDLLKQLNSTGLLHCVPASLKGKYVIRFTVTSQNTTPDDIKRDWQLIQEHTSKLMRPTQIRKAVPLAEIRKDNPHFGTSLLLSNSPMVPHVIDGSFAAILSETGDSFFSDFSKTLSEIVKNSPTPNRRIKVLSNTDRQLSLDSRIDQMNIIKEMSQNDPCHQEKPTRVCQLCLRPLSPEAENMVKEPVDKANGESM